MVFFLFLYDFFELFLVKDFNFFNVWFVCCLCVIFFGVIFEIVLGIFNGLLVGFFFFVCVWVCVVVDVLVDWIYDVLGLFGFFILLKFLRIKLYDGFLKY